MNRPGIRRDIATVNTECFSQGTHKDVGWFAVRELLSPPSRMAKCTDSMRVVYHTYHIFFVIRVMPNAQLYYLINRRMVTPHRENAIGDYQRSPSLTLPRFECSIQSPHVIMRIDSLTRWPTQPHRIDNAVVVEFVRDQYSLRCSQRCNRRYDRRVGR